MDKEPLTPATILLVEDDAEIRDEMKRFLEGLGYGVVLASNEAESQRLISDGDLRVALILIDQRMLSDEALATGRRIREHENVANSASVVVIPFEFSKGLEGTNESVGDGDYKSYLGDGQQLEDLLAELLPKSNSR